LKVVIYDEHGGFGIIVDGVDFSFSDDEPREKLVEVFQMIGTKEYDDLIEIEYELVY